MRLDQLNNNASLISPVRIDNDVKPEQGAKSDFDKYLQEEINPSVGVYDTSGIIPGGLAPVEASGESDSANDSLTGQKPSGGAPAGGSSGNDDDEGTTTTATTIVNYGGISYLETTKTSSDGTTQVTRTMISKI